MCETIQQLDKYHICTQIFHSEDAGHYKSILLFLNSLNALLIFKKKNCPSSHWKDLVDY